MIRVNAYASIGTSRNKWEYKKPMCGLICTNNNIGVDNPKQGRVVSTKHYVPKEGNCIVGNYLSKIQSWNNSN